MYCKCFNFVYQIVMYRYTPTLTGKFTCQPNSIEFKPFLKGNHKFTTPQKMIYFLRSMKIRQQKT